MKQRRTGLFWSLPALQRSAIKEACLSCRACGRDFLVQTMAVIAGAALRSGAHGYGAASDCPSASPRLSAAATRAGGRVGGSTTARPRLHRAGRTVASPANPSVCQARTATAPTGDAAMTDRIKEFLARNREDGPRLVVDLDVVRDNYLGFAKALPDTRVFYAVKANPAPEILDLLADLGSCFDTASIAEIEQALAAGATPDRISFGNTIKKERDIARAYALGVRLFAVDCEAEVEKIARAAPGSKVFCRILCDGAGAEWPLSRKFGCAPEMAATRARARPCARPRRARPVVPRRLAAAQPAHVGPRAEGLGGDLPRARRARRSSFRCSTSAAASRPAISSRCRRCAPTARRSSARCAAISATASRRRSSSRAAAWSATPGSSRRRWC